MTTKLKVGDYGEMKPGEFKKNIGQYTTKNLESIINNSDEEKRAIKMGITDVSLVYKLDDLVSKDVIFSASGVTDGSLLNGVFFQEDRVFVETLVMRSNNGTVRRLKTEYKNFI